MTTVESRIGVAGDVRLIIKPGNKKVLRVTSRIFELINSQTGKGKGVPTYFIKANQKEESFEARWTDGIPLKVIVKRFGEEKGVFSDVFSKERLDKPMVIFRSRTDDTLIYDIGSELWVKVKTSGQIADFENGNIWTEKNRIVLSRDHIVSIRDKAATIFEILELFFLDTGLILVDLSLEFGFWLDNNGELRKGDWILLTGLFNPYCSWELWSSERVFEKNTEVIFTSWASPDEAIELLKI